MPGGQKQRLSARARRKSPGGKKVPQQKVGGGKGKGLAASRPTEGPKSAAAALRDEQLAADEPACDDTTASTRYCT